jgi:hypothetical protein
MHSHLSRAAIAAFTVLATAGVARAHVSLASGPAQANKSQLITFGVGHGCDGHDTVKVRVDIPAGVTSVRALRSDFGKPTVIRDTNNVVIAVEWTKPDVELLAGDDAYYQLTIRARVPDAAFTQLQFNVHQTCRDDATGLDLPVVDWDQPPGSTTGNEAPMLTVVPARTAGWTQVTVPRAVADADLPLYFGDAAIVWRGTAAFSTNAATAGLIAMTPGVTPLAGGLAANDEIWVKY